MGKNTTNVNSLLKINVVFSHLRQKVDYVTLLEDRRKSLVENDASIEKCLMINRLISYINEVRFKETVLFELTISLP